MSINGQATSSCITLIAATDREPNLEERDLHRQIIELWKLVASQHQAYLLGLVIRHSRQGVTIGDIVSTLKLFDPLKTKKRTKACIADKSNRNERCVPRAAPPTLFGEKR